MKNQLIVLIIIIIPVVTLIVLLLKIIPNIQLKEEGDVVSSEVTEESIIETFNNNYDLFEVLATYIENSSDTFYYYKTNERIIFRVNGVEADINNYEIRDEIESLVEELGYNGIVEREGNIKFNKRADLVMGIIYVKNNGNIEEYDDPATGKQTLIKDSWYYYCYKLT